MTSNKKYLGFCIALALTAFAAGCNNEVQSCADVQCAEGQVCNPESLQCEDVPADKCAGVTCNAGEVCDKTDGQCKKQEPQPLNCVSPQVECDGACIDVSADVYNCGSCGNACSADQSCTNGSCVDNQVAECEDSEAASCDADGKVKKCVNGKYELSSCEEGEACNNGVCEAVVIAECEDSEDPICEDGKVKKCVSGKYELSDCGSGEVCTAGECVPGQAECQDSDAATCDENSNSVKSCSNGSFVLSPCGDQTCENGACIDKAQCDDTFVPVCDGNAVKTCSEEGKFVTTSCGDGEICADGACKSTAIDDLCPDDPDKKSPGICGCGIPDVDSDNNGTIDCQEVADLCPDDPNKTLPGICGCNIPDDLDDNGNPKCLSANKDLCPNDPDKTTPGVCGCGIPDKIDALTHQPWCYGAFHGQVISLCGGDKKFPGVCGCGAADEIGDDGLPTCLASMNVCEDVPNAAVCGCEADNTDTDADKVADCVDLCPENPEKIVKDNCGCGGTFLVTLDGKEYCAQPIYTAEEFVNLLGKWNASTVYALMEDINLADYYGVNELPWTPKDFKSKLVSSGKTISISKNDQRGKLTCAAANCGLFKTVSSGRIHNVNFDFNVESTAANAGIIAGTASASTITSVVAKGDVSGAGNYIGGVFGRVSSASNFANVKHEGNVVGKAADSSKSYVGGITGRATKTSFVTVENVGDVSSEGQYTAGIVGYIDNASVLSSAKVQGNISALGSHAAGIVGYAYAASADVKNELSSVSFEGNVTGTTKVAGLVGQLTNSEITSGSVGEKMELTGTSYVGGIVGQAQLGVLPSNIEVKDIVIKATASYTGGVAGWSSTAISDASVSGSIDAYRYAGGIVGHIEGAALKNVSNSADLKVNNTSTSTGAYAGGIAGQAMAGFTHENLKNSGKVTVECEAYARCNYAGGLFGSFEKGEMTTLKDSENSGEVNVKGQYVGGLVGYAHNASFINVANSGKVAAGGYLGGIVGYGYWAANSPANNFEWKNLINSGEVEQINIADATGLGNMGGIVSWVNQYNYKTGLTISNVVNSADVKGLDINTNSKGGLFGGLRSQNDVTMTDLYNTGNLTGGAASSGGLFGYLLDMDGSVEDGANAEGNREINIKLNRAYSTGDVISKGSNTGGLIGRVRFDYPLARGLESSDKIVCEANSSKSKVQYNYKYYDAKANVVITNVYASGVVKSATGNVGGLIGEVYGRVEKPMFTNATYSYDADCKVTTTNVNANEAVRAGKLTLANAFAAGAIDSNLATNGGLIGNVNIAIKNDVVYNSLLNNVYATGKVNEKGGSLFGSLPKNFDYKNIYFLANNGTGKITPAADIDGALSFDYDGSSVAQVADKNETLLALLNGNIKLSNSAELNKDVSASWADKDFELFENMKFKVPFLDIAPTEWQQSGNGEENGEEGRD